MGDPAAEAEAVVLIDEIDLHLHPKWQRQIVENLTTVFPQLPVHRDDPFPPGRWRDVEHDRIQIIANGRCTRPRIPLASTLAECWRRSWVPTRRSRRRSRHCSRGFLRKSGRQRFEKARVLLARLVERLGEDDPEVTRVRTLLDFMEGAE